MDEMPDKKYLLKTTTPLEIRTKKEIEGLIGIIAIPTIIAIIAEVCAFYVEKTMLIIWLVAGIIFIYLSFLLKYKYRYTLKRIIFVTITIGTILGLVAAIMRLATGYKFYLIFNLISEPALFAAVGALINSLIYLIFRKGVKNGRTKTNHATKHRQ